MNHFGIPISAPTLLALHAFLQTHPAAGSMGEVVDAAINAWLGQQTGTGVGDPGLGYQWKSLFLPAGTHIRFDYGGHTYHAQVQGDQIIYQGRPVSPRGMLMAVAGLTGNAWTLLRVRRPGDKQFFMPAMLRNRIQRDDPGEVNGSATHSAKSSSKHSASNSGSNGASHSAGNSEIDSASGRAERYANSSAPGGDISLVRRVVDALGRIETALRERREERPRRGIAQQERRQPCGRRESDDNASAACPSWPLHRNHPQRHGQRNEDRLDDVPFDSPYEAPVAIIEAAPWPPIHGLVPVEGAISRTS